jgi:hypothetical protein
VCPIHNQRCLLYAHLLNLGWMQMRLSLSCSSILVLLTDSGCACLVHFPRSDLQESGFFDHTPSSGTGDGGLYLGPQRGPAAAGGKPPGLPGIRRPPGFAGATLAAAGIHSRFVEETEVQPSAQRAQRTGSTPTAVERGMFDSSSPGKSAPIQVWSLEEAGTYAFPGRGSPFPYLCSSNPSCLRDCLRHHALLRPPTHYLNSPQLIPAQAVQRGRYEDPARMERWDARKAPPSGSPGETEWLPRGTRGGGAGAAAGAAGGGGAGDWRGALGNGRDTKASTELGRGSAWRAGDERVGGSEAGGGKGGPLAKDGSRWASADT